jgi:phosphoenolpyruvate carboxylase
VKEPTVQEALSADIRLLGSVLGQAIRRLSGEAAYQRVEDVRAAAKALRADPTPDAARALRDELAALEVGDLRTLIRAFSIYFDLINLAEQRARVRALRRRAGALGSEPQAESPEAALRAFQARGIGAEQVAEQLRSALICPVFTAHPSEARRRTILEKLNAIEHLLDRLEYGHLLAPERDQVMAAIAEEVETFWLTSTVRVDRPSVLDEVRQNIELVEDTLFDVVPRVYRELEAGLGRVYPERIGPVPSFLRFGSWIGGDRDGHPDVTHRVTLETVRLQQVTALKHYLSCMDDLWRRLSHSDQFVTPSEAFLASIRSDAATLPEESGPIGHEPYRAKCRMISAKLRRTLAHARDWTGSWSEESPPAPPGAYRTRHDLLADLQLIRDDLRRSGAQGAVDGSLQDMTRLVEVFGLHLLTLDLRQHSGRHASALDEIFRLSGVHGSYLKLNPEQRLICVLQELEQKRPLIPTHLPYSAETSEVVHTFRSMSVILEQQAPEALQNYIISSTTEPAHLLEVLLLARESRLFQPRGGISRIDIIPLFESLEPLRQSAPILQRLFELPIYRRQLELRGYNQEVMLGYSDSSKESGFLQSAWALYRTQRDLVDLGRKNGVTIQMFHGRGGAIGRGGGPANRAILAQPPGTVHGRLRMTEQGEVIADRYGHHAIAERHLEQVINALLRSSFPEDDEPSLAEWGTMLDRLAESACRHYRAFVYETPEFLRYFEQATPIEEIARLKIGSRPTRRSGSTRIEDLRAIPWVFSWMQCRHTLPGWYGLGSAIAELLEQQPNGLRSLQDMYRSWPFLSTLIDNAQMILAKADMTIARLYADLVAEPEIANLIFGKIATEYQSTVALVCRITGQDQLLGTMPILQNSIQQRNPYVDPLSFIQLVLLRRLRAGEEPVDAIRTGVLESINGVASGLKNTG